MCFCFSNARFKFSKLNLMIHIVELNEHFAHFNVIEAVTPVYQCTVGIVIHYVQYSNHAYSSFQGSRCMYV